jgi:hypothetical protein
MREKLRTASSYNHKPVCSLGNLQDSGCVNRTWDAIRQNINISAKGSLGYCESKHRKPSFDENSSKLVDRRKQAKFQWLQDPSEMNEDIYVRREVSRHFRSENRGYLKGKINELESNSKNKNIRDLYRA